MGGFIESIKVPRDLLYVAFTLVQFLEDYIFWKESTLRPSGPKGAIPVKE